MEKQTGRDSRAAQCTLIRRRESVTGWAGRLRQFFRPAHIESLQALLAAVDAKDSYTRVHSLNVAAYSEAIARRVHLPASRLPSLQAAALLHDVGKIGIPDRILNKPGPLTPDEFDIMARHPRIALDILAPLRVRAGQRAIILYHHERYDGRGYPTGLAGESIPIEARILAIADAMDTMLSARPYKRAFTLDHVRAEVITESGRQFDPYLAGMTLAWLEEWQEPAETSTECIAN